jgi:mannose-6-phosphate isomerase-like protein (cupin superfamily)
MIAMTTTGRRQGVKIYRAQDSPSLADTDFMYTAPMSDETQTAVAATLTKDASLGAQLRVLLRQAPEEGGFSLIHIWFKPHYPLLRHSHNVDCLYYVVSGSAIMGSQTLQAGDSFFVPADAPYLYTAGPTGVEVLEIRHGVDQFDINISNATPDQWQALAETFAEHQADWAELDIAPTFADRAD